jgi:protein-tyrosine kinase
LLGVRRDDATESRVKDTDMKIQKAMDKALKQAPKAVPLEKREAGPVKGIGAKEEWSPPVYRDSKFIQLDLSAVKEKRCVCIETDAPELDFYKVLRTQILHLTKPRGWRTVMITSILPGEGKTLTAINLALTFAKAYQQTILLVDCDFRQQKIYRYLGLNSSRGIVDYLVNGTSLKDLIVWPGVEKLTLISGGRTVSESAELLESPRMRELVTEMKNRYEDRYVLFDMPPLLSGADALTFSPLVDAIVVVVEEGRTSVKEVEKAVSLIPREKFLGFVLNRAHIPKKSYYSYYKDKNKGK